MRLFLLGFTTNTIGRRPLGIAIAGVWFGCCASLPAIAGVWFGCCCMGLMSSVGRTTATAAGATNAGARDDGRASPAIAGVWFGFCCIGLMGSVGRWAASAAGATNAGMRDDGCADAASNALEVENLSLESCSRG